MCLDGFWIPICVQCGTTDNPCRCKVRVCLKSADIALRVVFGGIAQTFWVVVFQVVGPTLGFLAMLATAIVEWPVGAAVWVCNHKAGRRIMGQPVLSVYPKITDAIPF